MATQLTPIQMKEFVRKHFEEFVNKRNAAVIRINMTPDFCDHDGPGGKPTDRDGDEQMMMAMYKTMPDLHLTIDDMVAEEIKSSARMSGDGRTQVQERRCNFTDSFFGASRAIGLRSDGPLLPRRWKTSNRSGRAYVPEVDIKR